jgi:rubrerythrin
LLQELADEELCHKGRLESIKKGRLELFREKGLNLNIDDCCVATELGVLMDSRDIITYAIKKENESVRLYRTLAKSLNWGGLRETFLLLAQEESKHKVKLEAELSNCDQKGN